MGTFDWNDDDGNPSMGPFGLLQQEIWLYILVGVVAIMLLKMSCSDDGGGGGTAKDGGAKEPSIFGGESMDFYDTAQRALKKLDEGKKLSKYERDCLNEYLEKEIGF